MFAGLGVGYLYVFGYLKWIETSAPNLLWWEQSWPFKKFKNHHSFRANASALQSNNATAARQGGGGFMSYFGGGSSSGTATQAAAA